MAYSITKAVGLSIVPKKKLAKAKPKARGPHFHKPLAQFLEARIGSSSPKMTATEVVENSGLSPGHISDLKNGNKPPENMTVDFLVRLADGMGESPVTLFNLARGETATDPQEARLRQMRKDYEKLSASQRDEIDVEFLIRELRNRIRKKLHGDV